MIFEANEMYHIYNQGNNRKLIFFSRDNYLFFLKKIKLYILPHADILAWCLMPNHFHLMVYIHTLEIYTHGVTQSHPVSKKRTLNDNIAIMLRSYTRAINKQNKNSGSLFREATKAECISKAKGITPSFYTTYHGSEIWVANPEKQYPQNCFNYIHTNPVETKLVASPHDWEFSSYCDYLGLRNGKLINRKRADELGLIAS